MSFVPITDFLFPRVCINCNEVPVDEFLCCDCLEKLDFITEIDVCNICGNPFGYNAKSGTDNKNLCQKCIEEKFFFSRCRSISPYTGYLRSLLHNFKYNGNSELSLFFIWFVCEYYPEGLEDCDILIPVPVFIDKLRKREFNQCAVIGAQLAKFFGFEYDPFILRKEKDTKAQVDLSNEKERIKNVRGVFTLHNYKRINGKRVLLFDDVFTTGSTTNECSKVLLQGGADNVQVLTMMRAVN